MIPPDILQSNRDLTLGERRHITQLSQDTDEKLKAVQKALAKLQQEEIELLKTAADCQLALAPILRLPPEVIGEIFLTCVRCQGPSMYHDNAPVLLTHICSSFRTIALSMPTLWETIALIIPEVQEYQDEDDNSDDDEELEDRITKVKLYLRWQVDAIEQWISRSRTLPLSIKCEYLLEPLMPQLFDDEQSALAEILLESAARWRYLSIQCHTECGLLFRQIMQLTPDKVPLLTSLRIAHIGHEKFASGDIYQAPTLTELSLRGNFDAAECHANWSQLTLLTLELSVKGAKLGRAPEILRQAKNLGYLKFDDTITQTDTTDDIYLPLLKELSVRGVGIIHDERLVADCIHAPALEILYGNDSVMSLTNLIKRSPHLHTLKINIHYGREDKLGVWLRNCPQITSLFIETNYPGDPADREIGLLEELAYTRNGTYTCPNLRIFDHNGVLAVPWDVLCQFLGAELGRSNGPLRTWEHVRLKVFITDWGTRDDNYEVVEGLLEEWKRAGLLELKIINAD